MKDHPLERLLGIMKTLRDEENGCAWDREQTLVSLTRHTLEEAYEVVDCIERGALDELPDELGDLLFQVVFYAQVAAEEGRFDFTEVSARIVAKLLRRHPHGKSGATRLRGALFRSIREDGARRGGAWRPTCRALARGAGRTLERGQARRVDRA